MATTNPRTSNFPQNAILMIPNTGSVPSGFSQACSLNCKYIKGIPTACTCPGCCTGASTHTHCSGGSHSHCASGCTSHTHTAATGGPSSSSNAGNCTACTTPKAPAGHAHTVTSTSSSPSINVCSGGGHTHDAVTNQVAYRTVSFYKKTESIIGLRRKALPLNTMLFYAGSTVPNDYSLDCTYNGKHIYGVASCPGTNAGTSCHTHASASHSHTIGLSCHSHTGSSVSCSGSVNRTFTGCTISVSTPHSHSAGGSFACGPACNTSSCAGGHTHDTISLEPTYTTLSLISKTSISIRKPSLEPCMVAVWVCPIACIPLNYQVSDGTGTTINLLGKYPKGSATPGCTGGSNTHTHSCTGSSHCHSASVAHTHSVSGSVGTHSGSTPHRSPPFAASYATVHNHSLSGCSSSSGPCVTTCGATFGHTHGSKNHEPPGVSVAFIQRA